MCGMGGGGGGGMGGGGLGGGGLGFGGLDFGIGNIGTGLSMGGGGDGLVSAPVDSLTKPIDPNDITTEGDKKFLGSKPGFSEKKMQALANRSGKSSLYIS
tara:strand:+ start:469 stop:768 length:300 start_codon:yes stop_codon:yes gene_type:complete